MGKIRIRAYLRIKNAIISGFVMGIFKSYIIPGTAIFQLIIVCAAIFVGMFFTLDQADSAFLGWVKEKSQAKRKQREQL